MKKTLLLSLVIGLSGAVGAMAQGVVNFSNSTSFSTQTTGSNGKTDRLVYNTDGVTLLGGTNFLAQIYWASGTGVTESLVTTAIDNTAITFFAPSIGKWIPASKTFSTVGAGNALTLQVRAWDGATGATSYDAAKTAGLTTGKSLTFNYTTAASTDLPSAKVMEGFQSFTMIVPEPTTIALGVLGAAGLLIARRRK